MNINFYKYQGAGNDFVLLDNRDNSYSQLDKKTIEKLCDRRFGVGADGMMLLENHSTYDFKMRYYNSDGGEASMCGNGGRCIVAFAKKLEIIKDFTKFDAVDGMHEADISGSIVNLKMGDINQIEKGDGFYFLDTGSPHYVKYAVDLNSVDIVAEGKKIRYNNRFKDIGTNVDIIEGESDIINMLTYERGVEDETLACGTGAVASALVHKLHKKIEQNIIKVITKGGDLEVAFKKIDENTFSDIWLKGPATFVFSGNINI